MLQIINANYLGAFKINIEFNDGIKKDVDFLQILAHNYPAFEPLKNIEIFKNYTITDTLEWNNGTIDIAPEYLYNLNS